MDIKNLGIPCYNPVVLEIYALTLSCAYNKSKQISREREVRSEAYERFTKDLDNKSIGKYKELLQKILFLSNDNSVGEFNINKYALKRNAFTRLILPSKELDLNGVNESLNNTFNELEEINTNLKEGNYTKDELISIKNKYKYLFNNKDDMISTSYFINNELNYYKELNNHIDNTDIDFSDLLDYYVEGLEPDKLGLYLAFTYLNKVEKLANEDIKKAQHYLFYVTGYIYSNLNKNTNFIYINGKQFTYKELVNRYNKLLDNTELKNLLMDRDLFINKNKNDNLKVIDSLINMERLYTTESFIKKGNDYTKESIDKRENTPITEEEIEFLRKYVNERYYLYLKNNPVARIECINYFSNYVAFLYENGNIVADRLKHINRVSECKKDAIYLFDMINFDELIKYNKDELRGIVKRIMHTEGWENRVEDVIKEEKEVDKVLMKQFISKHE